MSKEKMQTPENKSIFTKQPIKMDIDSFMIQLDSLKEVAYTDTTDIRKYIQEIVNTYTIN